MTPAVLSLWAGFVIGIVFGVTGQRTGFCLNTGIRNYLVAGDGNKLRAFALALALAIFGSQAADAAGFIDLSQSIYLGAGLSWFLLPLGGLLFGYGMVAANGCGARALVLMGQGNLRSFVVLVCLGIAAHMTLTGLLAPLRTSVATLTGATFASAPSVPGVLLASAGTETVARLLPAFLLGGALIWFAFSSAAFRASRKDVVGGVIIGALIPASWMATGWLGADDFDPVPLVALTFVAPVGDTIQYAMLATGSRVNFGVAVVCGVFVGALASALLSQAFHLEGFKEPGRQIRSMVGGALMGVGGALALGCSIGQGLSGLSTLAFSSFLAAGGILLGATLGLRGPLKLPAL
jgi:uncharacterized membrane protein YedE/YeeE